MYDKLPWEYYWPQRAKDVYELIDDGTERRGTGGDSRHQQQLKVFCASSPVSLLPMDILGLIRKKSNRNHFVIVITDRYSEFTSAVSVLKFIAWHAALRFINNWSLTWGIPSFLLRDNGLQFVSQLFISALCIFWGVKKGRKQGIIHNRTVKPSGKANICSLNCINTLIITNLVVSYSFSR